VLDDELVPLPVADPDVLVVPVLGELEDDEEEVSGYVGVVVVGEEEPG
jgi:hypothetical protein